MTDATSLLAPDDRDWRTAPGYSNYLISYDAAVYSVPRVTRDGKHLRGRFLKRPIGAQGYPELHLRRDDGKARTVTLHTLVAAAFHGRCPEGEEVRHKDGVRAHCSADNLEYGTSGENQLDKIRHGTHHYANREKCAEGHDLSGANLSVRHNPDGTFKQRICLQCRRDRAAGIAAAKPQITVICGQCFEPFEKPQTVGKSRLRYCGPECQKKAQRAQQYASQARSRAKRRSA